MNHLWRELGQLLIQSTIQVNEALGAAETAFNTCHRHKRLPILITSLSDPIPDSNGVEFLERANQLALKYGQSAFKIVFDESDPNLQQAANNIGANAFCTSADELVNTIDSYLLRMSGWTPPARQRQSPSPKGNQKPSSRRVGQTSADPAPSESR